MFVYIAWENGLKKEKKKDSWKRNRETNSCLDLHDGGLFSRTDAENGENS